MPNLTISDETPPVYGKFESDEWGDHIDIWLSLKWK